MIVELGIELLKYMLVFVIVKCAFDSMSLFLNAVFTTLLIVVGLVLSVDLVCVHLLCFVIMLSFIELYFTLKVRNKSFNDFSEEMTMHIYVLNGFERLLVGE